jgi:simple sugar transport system ATP-binding protein
MVVEERTTKEQVASGGAAPVPFLVVEDIHKWFGGVHALRGVSVSIKRGEIYHLLGENGCGKSTLIKIISGAQPPDQGKILIEGVHHPRLDPIRSLMAGIETVYQDLSLIPNLTVAENVALSEQLVNSAGRLARKLDRVLLQETARRALASVHLPTNDEFLDTVVAELPLAIRQLIAISRAIATKAKLVIMDEPTTSLTKREVDNLIRVVHKLRQDQVSVLFVTHKLDECYVIGGHAIVFRDGECVAQGPIESYTKTELGRLMTGKEIQGSRYRHARPGNASLLQVKDLARQGQFERVSFELAKGEILGITGLMDSGRNELALALAGVMAASSGEILLEGRAVSLRAPRDAIIHGIGYVPEDRLAEGLFLDKSILSNMVAAILDSVRTALGSIDFRKSRAIAQGVVDELRIVTPSVDLPVQSLSGGNQQRVLIGRWLTIDPKLLVLHGPTVGVDVGSKDTIYKAIQVLAERGMGVIIISDDLPEILQNCDRILVMCDGTVTAQFEADAVQADTLYQAMVASERRSSGD